MKIKKAYFLVVLFLCGLSVGSGFASASAAAAATSAEETVANALGQELIEAARVGKEEKVEELIVRGANVNAACDQYEITPLIWAATYGYENIVDLLLQKEGIEVNAEDVVGWTALMKAAARGNADIVQKLLNAGADKDMQDMAGRTAAEMAEDRGNRSIAKMIRDFVLPSGRRTKAAR